MKTPQQSYPELAKALGLKEVFLKREDLHKYQSHKGRSIPTMIKNYAKAGYKQFVISSSGNAALAAALATSQHNKNNPGKEIKLTIFVGEKIDQTKLTKIKSLITDHCSLISAERPKQAAFQAEKENPETVKNLRQSTDDLALEGYISLAQELCKIENISAIFLPTSSGTTAEALANYFVENNKKIQLHIVQTNFCHPIAKNFDEEDLEKSSLASAIVDNVAHRKNKVVELIKQTGGFGWIINDNEIIEAQKLVKITTGIEISANSALSIAGLKKAAKSGFDCGEVVACIITGR